MPVPNQVMAISVNSDSAGRTIVLTRKHSRRLYLTPLRDWIRLTEPIMAMVDRDDWNRRMHLELTRLVPKEK